MLPVELDLKCRRATSIVMVLDNWPAAAPAGCSKAGQLFCAEARGNDIGSARICGVPPHPRRFSSKPLAAAMNAVPQLEHLAGSVDQLAFTGSELPSNRDV